MLNEVKLVKYWKEDINIMTDNKDLKYNTPPTYEQFILEATNLEQKDLYPDLVQEDISNQGGYGPSGYNQEYIPNYPCCRGPQIDLEWRDPDDNRTPGLIIRLTGGTYWYYTDDSTSGVGGAGSWWNKCNTIFTKSNWILLSTDEQWRTSQMHIRNANEAQLTINAFNNNRIVTLNAIGGFSENARTKEGRTLDAINRALSVWNSGSSVYANIGV